jgi:hypothetical protein
MCPGIGFSPSAIFQKYWLNGTVLLENIAVFVGVDMRLL